MPKYPHVAVTLKDGDTTFAILAAVIKALREAGVSEDWYLVVVENTSRVLAEGETSRINWHDFCIWKGERPTTEAANREQQNERSKSDRPGDSC